MVASKTKLNCKFMSSEQAEEVEEMIQENAHKVFSLPFSFTALTNHIPGISCLTIKKHLFRNIKTYF